MTAKQVKGSEMFDFDAIYSSSEYPGIAFRIDKYYSSWSDPAWILMCDDLDCDHESEWCYQLEDSEEITDETQVIGHMVGDDHEYVLDVSELTELSDDDFCGSCGQIGCGWY